MKALAGLDKKTKLAELHVHLGGSVDPAVMWEIAHAQGIRLPTKDYWEFVDLVTVTKRKKTFEEYLSLFKWTELIQSSPLAVERSVYQTVAGAYRKNNITLLELRFNPMKRNRGGEQDLDQIMMAAVHGLDRASLEYPVKTGLIVCLDRTFGLAQNEILVDKAILFAKKGVVGIDIAGPAKEGFSYADYSRLFNKARSEGLGLTVHAGEDEGPESVGKVLKHLSPERIGHGVRATDSDEMMKMLRASGTVLEVCPTSNIHTGVLKDLEGVKKVFQSLRKHKISYTINTDGPEMLATRLRDEIAFLLREGIATEDEVLKANAAAFRASFVK